MVLFEKFRKRRDLLAYIRDEIDALRDYAMTDTVPIPSAVETTDETSAERTDALQQSFTISLGMEFVLVPAGGFQMGSKKSEYEKPIHQVTIQRPFYIQTTQVTQEQWQSVMGENPSHFRKCGHECPVESVSWDDVKQFLVKLNENGEGEYRLPTEAEWEYAARSGGKDQTYAGGENLDELGWYSKNCGGRTHTVGQKKPNSLGIYDMSGNVDEWVEDDWHDNYNGAPDDGSAWIDKPRDNGRVIRGGCWHYDAGRCRSASRSIYGRGYRDDGLGFRLTKSVTLSP